MALKLGKTKEEIAEMVKKKNSLLESGDITNKYKEMMIDVKPNDIGVVEKNNVKAFDEIVNKAKDKIVELDISSLSESPKNHFSKISGAKKEEFIGSLKAYGQITPIIVRPKEYVENYKSQIENDFEILVGHTRVACLKEIGKDTVKAIIVKCDDVEATLMINQSNIQREKVTDVEMARAYKATYDALVQNKNNNLKQGTDMPQIKQNDVISYDKAREMLKNENVEISTDSPKPQNGTSGEVADRTDEIVAEKYGISKNTLRRKMALADCSYEIIKMFNKRKITQEQIQYLSKISKEGQEQIVECLKEDRKLGLSFEDKVMTKEIAEKLLNKYEEVMEQELSRSGIFPRVMIKEIIEKYQPEKKEGKRKKSKGSGISVNKETGYIISDKYFPKELARNERQEYIENALQYVLDNNINLKSEIEQEV